MMKTKPIGFAVNGTQLYMFLNGDETECVDCENVRIDGDRVTKGQIVNFVTSHDNILVRRSGELVYLSLES